jgi:hypothetical protein
MMHFGARVKPICALFLERRQVTRAMELAADDGGRQLPGLANRLPTLTQNHHQFAQLEPSVMRITQRVQLANLPRILSRE